MSFSGRLMVKWLASPLTDRGHFDVIGIQHERGRRRTRRDDKEGTMLVDLIVWLIVGGVAGSLLGIALRTSCSRHWQC
jgi:hypothetical protein